MPYNTNAGYRYTYQNLYKMADYALKTKVAYCKIWEGDGQGNDTLVRHFVPSEDKGQPCVYDKVRGNFCYSSEPSYTVVGND